MGSKLVAVYLNRRHYCLAGGLGFGHSLHQTSLALACSRSFVKYNMSCWQKKKKSHPPIPPPIFKYLNRITHLKRFLELLDELLRFEILGLTQVDVLQTDLGHTTRAELPVWQYAASADDGAERKRDLSRGSTKHFVDVEQSCRGVFDVRWQGVVDSTERRFTAAYIEYMQLIIIIIDV